MMCEFAKTTRALIEIVWALRASLCFRREQNVSNAGNRRCRLPELKSWLCIVFVIACLSTAVSAQAQEPNEALILASYHPTMEWTKSVVGTIESELLRSGTDVEIHTEYMDTKHFSDRNHYTNLYALFRDKAKREQYDVIITVDNNALLFLLKHRNELYPNVPIVFCGVDHYHGSMYERHPSETTIEEILGGHDSVTGVLEEFDYERTIEVALKLHPLARRVILINDGINEVTYYPHLSEEDVTNLAERFAGRAEFETLLLTESNLDQVIEKIRQRRRDSVVLLTNTFLDTEANLSLLRGRFPTFCRRCDAPVHAVDGSLLQLGHLLGGYINDGYAQGKIAADMALRILGGESPGNIPIITKSPNRYIFKYPQMRKFGISPADLPPGSTILDQPETFYYRYKGRIWAVIAVIVVLALMVVILSVNIFRRKLAEENLRIKNIAIGSSINAIAFVDMQSNLTDVNNSFIELWGYRSQRQVLGKPALRFWADEDKASEVLEIVHSKGSWVGELTARRKDGSVFDAQLSASLIRNEAGDPLCIMASFIDITEHGRAEEKLKQYQFMVESAHDAIFFKNLESRYVIANNQTLEAFGLSREQVIGKSDYEIMPNHEEAGKNIEDDQFVFETGKLKEITKYMTGADGKKRWFQAIKVPQLDDKGNIIGLVGVARDITAHKKAEEALRESEERYKALFEGAAEGILVADIETKQFMYVNPAVCRMLGYTEDEVKQMGVWDIHPKEHLEHVISEFEAQARGDKTLAPNIPCLRKDGTIMYADIDTARVVVDGRGCNVGFLTDITERKKAEEQLQRARDELEIRVEQRTADLARAIEELRSEIAERKKAERKLLISQKKLRSLASELSLAEERLRRRMATDVHDRIGQNLAISKIKLESLRQSASSPELAGALEEISKLIAQTIESSRSLTFELSPPVLYELGFEAAVEWLVRQMRQQHGLSTEFKDDGQSKPLVHDVRVLLFQAVRELLVNVAKHAQARNVMVSARRVGNQIQVSVEDDGVGFDTSEVSSRDYKTGGFGLFSIRERLGDIGGRLDIESGPGRGTRVALVAPVDQHNRKERDRRK